MTEEKTIGIGVSEAPAKKQSQFLAVLKRLSRRPTAVVGGALFLVIVFCAIFGDLIAPYNYNQINMREVYETPSLRHLFGTDQLGRDIFSRMLVGAKYTLSIGIGSQIIALTGGLIVGSCAGFFGQTVDNIIMRILDVIQSIPGMIMNIVLAAVLGLGLTPCILAMGIGGITGTSRMVRGNILKIRKSEFVDAATSINCSTPRIIAKHVLPNILSPIIISVTGGIGGGIMGASGLSYLGLGVQPPHPEWGAMLSGGKDVIQTYPHVCLMPGLVIAVTMLSINLMGDGLRDALDPKLKK